MKRSLNSGLIWMVTKMDIMACTLDLSIANVHLASIAAGLKGFHTFDLLSFGGDSCH